MRSYWPIDCVGLDTLEAFERLFQHFELEEIVSPEFEDGRIKLALYTMKHVPTHMARQLQDGTWTSKLGGLIDLRHELDELEGPVYGTVAKILQHPID